jgi:polar amino acid transport system substrate-binding protein
MKLFKKILAAGLVAAMSLSVMGCGGKDETANSDDVISAGETEMTNDSQSDESTGGVITFGTNAEFPPFEYVSSNGVIDTFDGIDMAIAKEIASQNGSTAAINNMEFDSLLLALQNGQVDAVIAGMTITDERKEAVDFSIPYYTATQVMIVKEDSDIKSAADMADKKIVVVQGYTGETCVKDLGYKYEAFKKGSETILELINGKCDVVVIDSATAEKYVGDNEGLKIVEDNTAFEAEEYGIAVKKGNTELLDKINTAIQSMLDDGTIGDIAAEYLDADSADGSDESASAGEATITDAE